MGLCLNAEEREESQVESRPDTLVVSNINTKRKKVITVPRGEKIPHGYIADDYILTNSEKVPNIRLAEILPGLKHLRLVNQESVSMEPGVPPQPLQGTSSANISNQPTTAKTANSSNKNSNPLPKVLTTDEEKELIKKYKKNSVEVNASKLNQVQNQSRNSHERPPGVKTYSKSSSTNLEVSLRSSVSALIPKPSASIVPVGQVSTATTKPTKEGKPFLFTCKICRQVFMPNHDYKFRLHLFVKHGLDIGEGNVSYYEGSKVYPSKLLQCKKCRIIVLNNREDHQLRCNPSAPINGGFEKLENWNEKKYVCGIEGCEEGFEMRYLLRKHVDSVHKQFSPRMILEPDFRCGFCLKRFDDSCELGQHISTCEDTVPKKATLLGLAKRLLQCDYCETTHEKLNNATNCYLMKGVFRCVFCLGLLKSKKTFYSHLFKRHGLRAPEPYGLLLKCPMESCKFGPGKYTVVFPHIVSDHYEPILIKERSMTAAVVPSTSTPQEASVSAMTNPASASVTTVTRNSPIRNTIPLPELRPMTNPITSTPGGLTINMTRASTAVRTSRPQLYTTSSGRLILTHNSSTASGNANPNPTMTQLTTTTPIRHTGPGTPTTTLYVGVNPGTPMTSALQVGNGSPAVSLPMSAGFVKATQGHVYRTIGLVRPLNSAVSSTPSILNRPQNASLHRGRIISANPPPVVNRSTIPPIPLQAGTKPLLSIRTNVPVANNVTGPTVIRSIGGHLTQNPPQPTYLTGSVTIQPVVVASNAPTVRASTPSSSPVSSATNLSNTNVTSTSPSTSNGQAASTTEGGNSRIFTINERSYEFKAINGVQEDAQSMRDAPSNRPANVVMRKLVPNPASRSAVSNISVAHVQSASGLTIGRSPTPNNTSQHPAGATVRLLVPSSGNPLAKPNSDDSKPKEQ